MIDLQHVREVVKAAEASLGPVASAGILPADAYVSPAFWAFERQAIFGQEWLCIAHANEVPNPGDHLPLTVNSEPLLVVRDEEGTVRVLSAICQHRGHPIFGGVRPAPPPGQSRNATRFICPYHNWMYGLDGTLRGAPSMSETASIEELREHNSLRQIRSEVFHGLVFVHFGTGGPSAAERFGKLDAEFRAYGLADLVPGHVYPQQNLAWNWKLHHENALEPYHTSFVHRGYHGAVPSRLTKFRDFDPEDGQVMRTTDYESSDGDLFERAGTRRLPELEGLNAAQRRQVLFLSLMPCAVAVLQPSYVTITFLNPTAADRLDSRRVNLYPRSASQVPEFDRIRSEQFEQMKTIIEQDAVTQVELQRAYHSRYTPRGRLSYLETAIAQLNAWVVHRYRQALPALAAEAHQR